MSAPDSAPGLYGKVYTHGDFIARRLPPAFVSVWDAWLQGCLQGSRAQLGEAWLDTYLTSPVWRFALAPGVCDANAWAGVLIPSVDRVGRHFPLVLAAGAAGGLPLPQWMEEGAPWYEQIEQLALSALDEGFNFEQLDAQLQAMAGLAAAPAAGSIGAAGYRIEIDDVSQAVAALPELAAAALFGQSVWWTDGSERLGAQVLMCRGLPTPQAFAGMLGP